MSTIYLLLKRMITTGNYNKEDMENKLNVFFAVNQITQEQYLELLGLIAPKKNETQDEKPAQNENIEESQDEKVEQPKDGNNTEEA